MALKEELAEQGQWLFRWRSYLPLVIVALSPFALYGFTYPAGSPYWNRVWALICLGISISGVIFRAVTVGSVPRDTSGRNTKEQRAKVLNSTGMYSIVRHPLYFGNFLMWLGLVLCVQNGWYLAVMCLSYWIYYERIMYTEEEFLRGKFGDAYLEWSKDVPPFFPRFRNWKKPELSFSFRNALRREYSGIFAMVSIFALLNLIQTTVVRQEIAIDPFWVWFFVAGLAFYLVVMTLKKKTSLLVKGIR